jgi:small subunit ribosomal protein S2
MPYVTERWMGGMLTNWNTMFKRIQELERLENLRDSGDINRLTKKEGLLIERDITRLQTRLSGARSMKRVPDLLFIVDVGREDCGCPRSQPAQYSDRCVGGYQLQSPEY